MNKSGRMVLFVVLCAATGGGCGRRGGDAPESPVAIVGLVESRPSSAGLSDLESRGPTATTTTNVPVSFTGELALGAPEVVSTEDRPVTAEAVGSNSASVTTPVVVAADTVPAPQPTHIEPRPVAAPRGAADEFGVQLDDVVMARISFDWRRLLPGWQIQFVGPRQGYRGSTFPDRRVIQVYVRPEASLDEVAHVTAHEMGHAIDVTYFDDVDRSRFNLARGRSASSPWWVAPGATDFASGAGDWAESFAWSQVGSSGGWFSQLGSPPNPLQFELIAALTARSAP